MKESILKFWERNPALFYGLIFFLGCLFALQTPWVLLPFVLLLHKRSVFQASILFLFPCCMIYHLYTFPPTGSSVEGVFYTHSIKKTERFGNGWNYSGILKTPNGRIPCRCFSKCYFSPSAAYKITGSVRPLKGKFYSLKSKEPWEFVRYRFTLTAWRSRAQEYVKEYIEKHVHQKRAVHFLQGMITGQLEDRVMMNEFSQLGLSHLMAISGLHFSLIALSFHLLFRLFLPYKLEALCMIVLLTGYLLFIGDSPSILRTWIAVMIFLLGQLFEKRSSALNSLGAALFLSLIWNPLTVMTLSFQLSFLATGGILFFYSPCDRLLGSWLPKHSLKDAAAKHWIWQHGYILVSFFREALALTLSVHIAIFLLLIKTFHFFSLNSLFYNLFFPFLASAALLFFLVSLPLGHWAHVVNGYYCDWILRLSESPPLFFKSIYVEPLAPWLYAILLTLLLVAAIGTKIENRANSLRITNDPLFNHL